MPLCTLYPTREHPASLPPEVLLHIFRNFTQPEPHQCDPSVIPGPHGVWLSGLRAKRALTLVCKAWTPPATELLYTDIVIRRMGQIAALADTLQSGRPRRALCRLVRSLRLDSCIVWQACEGAIWEDVSYLLRECTLLQSFSFHAHPQFLCAPSLTPEWGWSDRATSQDAFNPCWVLNLNDASLGDSLRKRLASGLSSLDLAFTLKSLDIFHLVFMFACAPHLTSLSLGPVESLPTVQGVLTSIILPALKTLQVYLDHDNFSAYLTTQWHMPQLTALTCIRCDAVPIPLLTAHGKKLTFLHLYDDEAPMMNWRLTPENRMQDGGALLPLLHELCPTLEHLILAMEPDEFSSLNIRSPTLRYLDIVYAHSPTVKTYKTLALSSNACASALESVRFVEACKSAPNIPVLCHPSLCLPAASPRRSPFVDFSHVTDYDVQPCGYDPQLLVGGGIVHIFANARMLQQAWVVAHEPRASGAPFPTVCPVPLPEHGG